jgi:hypothetical protein
VKKGDKFDVEILESSGIGLHPCLVLLALLQRVTSHVLNRGNARSRIFEKEQDYEAFKHVIGETAKRMSVKISA